MPIVVLFSASSSMSATFLGKTKGDPRGWQRLVVVLGDAGVVGRARPERLPVEALEWVIIPGG